MAEDNEYIKEKSSEKKKTPRKKTVSKESNGTVLNNLSDRFNKKKLKTTIGVVMILLSFYLFLSFVSYLMTWDIDQDRVMNKGLLDFLFEENETPVANWLGKFGAWTSHVFMFNWFGISSFGFCLILLLLGAKIAFNYTLLPIRKTLGITVVFIVWSALLLGFFAKSVNFFGGSFGYQLNQWLSMTLGNFGTFILIAVLLYLSIALLFDTNLGSLLNFFRRDNADSEEEIDSTENYADISVINTLKDNDIELDKDPEIIHFDEDEDEDIDDDELELITSKVADSVDQLGDDDEDDDSSEVIDNYSGDGEFSVDIAAEDKTIDEDDMDALRKEFGEYDPTLDLASYVLPPIDLLNDYGGKGINIDKAELESNKNKIVETLANYKIEISKIKATVGPTVTLYEIIPAPGVRISKIKNLEDDIALSLAALGIRIIAPIPGKGTIGIEVPNSKPEMVSMRALIASEKFQNSDFELPIVMGKTITNETYTFDLAKLPHLLVAGATGQGKSVGLNAILVSLLYKKHPAQVKFVLIDPKKVELTLFNKIERHFLAKLPGDGDAIITDTSKVVDTLNSLCIEMDDRYDLLKEAHCRTIKEYNSKFIARKLNPEKGHKYMPYIVVLIDEFADLIMTAGKEVEHPIARIAQLARAVGLHLIVATQRPSVNVITGMIKANFPARMAFRVLSKIDSRTILDASGADQLIGRGDMLISTGSDLVRLQCGFVDTPEVEKICDFIGDQRAYPDAYLLPEYIAEGGDGNSGVDMDELDVLFPDAARIIVQHQQGSASLLQRKLKLGYNRAGRLVDQLEGMGIIGPFQGSKARDVLYADLQQLEVLLASKGLV